MKTFKYPTQEKWAALAQRPTLPKNELNETVNNIMNDVKQNGDEALFRLTEEFDGAKLDNLQVSDQEIEEAINAVPDELKKAIELAKNNITKFHKSQQTEEAIIETSVGVKCWRKSIAIEKVGLYIPGGTAPLFSTILMLGIPAKIASCKEIILCTPPAKDGTINPAILYTANLIGINIVVKCGGAQAIAALCYGTKSIASVNKIFGPGNQYVTSAKEKAQNYGVAIDMPAGPSEVLVIADETCNPIFVAADLLSQAEHGADSQVILLGINEFTLAKIEEELNQQLEQLPRKEIAKKALLNSKTILLNSMNDCFDFSNLYAPEHLIIASENTNLYIDQIINAGSVFLGNYSCESAGDYASGTNHTLPTNGYARNYSGVSLDSFVKKVTFQELSKTGIQNIGNAIELMAEAEELMAHKNAVTVRLKALQND